MKKKQIKHFVLIPDSHVDKWGPNYTPVGIPTCKCYRDINNTLLMALKGEAAKGRWDTTCGNCRRTLIFRKLK